MNEAVKEYKGKRKLNYSRVTQEEVSYVMSRIGPFKDISVEECQELTGRIDGGRNLASEALRKMRDEGR